MNKYIKMIEELRLTMLKEKDELEEILDIDDKFVTMDMVYCRLCDAQLEMEIGSDKFEHITETEYDKLMDEMLNS